MVYAGEMIPINGEESTKPLRKSIGLKTISPTFTLWYPSYVAAIWPSKLEMSLLIIPLWVSDRIWGLSSETFSFDNSNKCFTLEISQWLGIFSIHKYSVSLYFGYGFHFEADIIPHLEVETPCESYMLKASGLWTLRRLSLLNNKG